jgi:GNAT superfamily N-acetyltransferase
MEKQLSLDAGRLASVPRIRAAERSDVDALRTLIHASVRALSAGYYDDVQIEGALAHVFGPDTQLIDDRTYYVIEEGGDLAAAGGWSRRRTLYGGDQFKRGPDPLLDPAQDPARIRAFFVHPAWARRGLGRLLFNTCHDAARAAGFRGFELVATLPGAPLYAALGFDTTGSVSVSLPGGSRLPCLSMTRRIDDP